MAMISNFGPFARLRADSSQHILRYRNGALRKSGRGLVFWFLPHNSSLAEVPLDDRQMTLFIKGRSADFQDVTLQGVVGWRAREPELAADRIDFTIAPRTGRWIGNPIDSIESRISGSAAQAALDHFAKAKVRELLDQGIDALRDIVVDHLASEPSLAEIGVEIVSVRLSNLAPSSELERALQTPTFEALQQKADEATFERRAMAVENERAISENELATQIELAKREKVLIAERASNARDEAKGLAEAEGIAASAEAERIREVEGAKAETELSHMAVYREVTPEVLLGLAARDFAAKIERIDQLNVSPDMLASVLREFGMVKAASAQPAIEG